MPKFLPSVTHAVVTTVQGAKEMEALKGTMAVVELCCGPGDEDKIGLISIKKMVGPVTGVQAHIPRAPFIVDGKTKYLAVFSGKVADEIRLLALVAFDRVKQVHGLKFNKKYRVLAKNVEEIVAEVKAATV